MVATIVKNQGSFGYNSGATILHYKDSKWWRPRISKVKTAAIHTIFLVHCNFLSTFKKNNIAFIYRLENLTPIFYNSGGPF